jgi:hypothetical protein
MNNSMSFAERLTGLRRLLPLKRRGARRQRPGSRVSKVAAEVSALESRCLMSSNVLAGAHHNDKVSLAESGNPVIVKFDGYDWNSNYNWSQDSGPYVSNQLWSPSNVAPQADGLHLSLTNTTINGQVKGVSADVELVGKADGKPFHPGYGTYLVSVKTANGESFSQFANNQYAIFGAFTYQNLHGAGQIGSNKITELPRSLVAHLTPGMSLDGNLNTGSPIFQQGTTVERVERDSDTVVLTKDANYSGLHTVYFTPNNLTNRKRELDALEISRFGGSTGENNAQVAVQPTQANDGGIPENVQGFRLNDSGAVTTVMKWLGPKDPVTFDVYYGSYTSIGQLKGVTPKFTYTTTAKQKKFIPDTSQQTFHLNLWQFNYNGAQPTPAPTSVVVTKFQYEPLPEK